MLKFNNVLTFEIDLVFFKSLQSYFGPDVIKANWLLKLTYSLETLSYF